MKRLLILIVIIISAALSYAPVINSQTTTITGTNCPGNGCVSYPIAGQGSFGVQITGTWVGTITFKGSIGTATGASSTFVTILGYPAASTTGVTSTTANGVWFFTIAGLSQVRIEMTSYTSGSASILQRSTTAARKPPGSGGGGAGTVTSVGLTAPTAVFDVGSSPVTDSGTIALSFDTQSANLVFAGPSTGSAAAPTFRSLVAADVSGLVGGGTVTSVGLLLPTAIFDISSSPVTSTGTLTGTLDSQSANLVFAGPTTGGSAAPTFRSLVAADISGLVGAGTVTSVGLSLPTNVFDVASSPITSNGTIAATFDSQTANTIFAGPSTGANAAPTFRALVAADLTGLSSPVNATYITQTANASLSNEQAIGLLSTGIMKVTTTTGVISIATSADVIDEWTGTCNASSVLGGDGACSTISTGFDVITAGTNTTAAMLIGSGASLTTTGTGSNATNFIAATNIGDAPPSAGDCDNIAEVGKLFWNQDEDDLYICSGASGWRKIATAAP